MKNLLTFDIEDWYHPNLAHPEALAEMEMEDRVVEPTLRILNILDNTENTATFFVVGEIVEKFPDLVREILARGHEVGSHGHRHNLVYHYTKHQFETDISRSIQLLREATGRKILGYRAPSWSLDHDRTPWAWEVLADNELQYDSSLYPYKTFLYGSNEAPTTRYLVDIDDGRKMREIPPSAIELAGRRFPFSGGFFFRAAPLWYIFWCIRRYNAAGHPANIYLHPWEIDPGQPRVPVGPKDRLILYLNISRTERKLQRLCETFRFVSIREHLGLEQKSIEVQRMAKASVA
jgi:polysaccharide deacetylase family protein (PEP-CTERM system associated)